MSEIDSIEQPEKKGHRWWQKILLTLQIIIALILAIAGLSCPPDSRSPTC
ncbi:MULTISPECIES: hypothetical protein [Fischerella]|nr:MULTISPECIES: hypothetical protein [Fischerella]BAU05666.1 sodium:dicarboxylate symporter [Fischerella sp. NIES-3754]BCX07936.1 MAG: hypothetical protein KatS3mg066_1795 [Fischerella sp.]